VLEQAFEEVHGMKTTVFGIWEVADFTEVSFDLFLHSQNEERTKL